MQRVPAPSSGLRILESDAEHGKAIHKHILFVVWRRETRASAYARIGELVAQLAQDYPDGIGILQTVEVGAIPPDAGARQEFLKVMEICQGRVRHFSVVHEGTGFKAASVRAIMSGVYFYVSPKFPHGVFSSLTEAAHWHVRQEGGLQRSELTERDIVEDVRTLREHLNRKYDT